MKIYISEKERNYAVHHEKYFEGYYSEFNSQEEIIVESLEQRDAELYKRIFKQVYDYSNDLFQEGMQSTITMEELNFIFDKELQKERGEINNGSNRL